MVVAGLQWCEPYQPTTTTSTTLPNPLTPHRPTRERRGIVNDDDRCHLPSLMRREAESCNDQPLHKPLSRRSDGGSQARRTAHAL